MEKCEQCHQVSGKARIYFTNPPQNSRFFRLTICDDCLIKRNGCSLCPYPIDGIAVRVGSDEFAHIKCCAMWVIDGLMIKPVC